jgi:hypothetical protein
MEHRFVFDVPANGRMRKATVTVLDEGGNVVAQDRADMESMEERGKMVKRLCRRLKLGARRRAIADKIDAKWNETVTRLRNEHLEREAAAAAASPEASGPEGPDAEEQRQLAATPEDVRAEAEEYLRSGDLMKRVAADLEAVGVAGEKKLGVLTYLVGTSRKLRRPSRPLALRLKGASASGKSHIIELACGLLPRESIVQATSMTPQCLYYMEPGALRHKLIQAGERSRLQDDEAAEATRALREMISAGRLSKLVTVKLGNEQKSVLIEQEGPIAFMESTTLNHIFDEDVNRFIEVFTDEQEQQTRAIITRIAFDHAGLGVDTDRIVRLHQTAQRLLSRQAVVVPYAPRLGGLFPSKSVEARRGFGHLMNLIEAITLLHQWQRELDARGRLVATAADYKIARCLLAEPMARLLGGSIPQSAIRFEQRLREWFQDKPFNTKEAQRKEQASRRSVYDWLSLLHDIGHLQLVEESKGRKPAVWQLEAARAAGEVPEVLPAEDEVFSV